MDYGKDPRFKKYYHFVQKLKRIEKQREVEALNVIRTAAKGGFVVKQTKIKTSNTGTEVTTVESTLAPHWQAAAGTSSDSCIRFCREGFSPIPGPQE